MDPIIQQQFDNDFIAYEQIYAENKNVIRKPRPEATKPGKIEHSGKPLDFSFLNLTDVENLKKERARGGKRKPILKDDDEEDQKKDNAHNALADEKMEGGDAKEKKESMVVKSTAVPQINNILANYSVQLAAPKNGIIGGRKQDDGNQEEQRKKEVDYKVTALLLNNNQLRDIKGLYQVLDEYVMYDIQNLRWLNLSYNYLVSIDKETIKQFVNLQSLQLHGNYIYDLQEVKKLNGFENLLTLSLNGNPIESIKGYRLYVLGIMYQKHEVLKKLDSVYITKKEFEAQYLWNNELQKNINYRRLMPSDPTYPKKPPVKEEEENANK